MYKPLLSRIALLTWIYACFSKEFAFTDEKEFLQMLKSNHQFEGENIYEFLNRITHGKIFNMSLTGHHLLEEMGYHPQPLNKSIIPDFKCDTTFLHNRTKATSVHQLTPYDIDIIGAMGDSITAGFGECAYTLVDLFIECRGVSWSIGGDKTIKQHITLPNIIKAYNSKLSGYSVGISPPLIRTPNNNLNVAVSGSTSPDMLDQAKKFVEEMLINPDYDFFDSWKVLTLFVGGNDLCACCRTYKNYNIKYSPTSYVKGIKRALDYLHQRVPKLFVNLINAPDVTILEDLASIKCDVTHYIECKCGTVYGEKARNYTYYTGLEYHEKFQELIGSGRYDTRDDFTVVIQPFFDETAIPRLPNGDVDRSYFAPDCFHFTRKAHAASALALWNSMLEPVGKKNKHWEEEEPWKCPSKEHPYFYTSKNSNGRLEQEIIAHNPEEKKNVFTEQSEKESKKEKVNTEQRVPNDSPFNHLRLLLVRFHSYLTQREATVRPSQVVNLRSSSPDHEGVIHQGHHSYEWYEGLHRNEMVFFSFFVFMFVFIAFFLCKTQRK